MIDLANLQFDMHSKEEKKEDSSKAQHAPALARVRKPAIFLICVWGLSVFRHCLGIVSAVLGRPVQAQHAEYFFNWLNRNWPQIDEQYPWIRESIGTLGSIGLVASSIGLALSILGIVGAVKMMKLRALSLAILGGVLAVIPCNTSCCFLVGMPVGIWALSVLNKKDVCDQFS